MIISMNSLSDSSNKILVFFIIYLFLLTPRVNFLGGFNLGNLSFVLLFFFAFPTIVASIKKSLNVKHLIVASVLIFLSLYFLFISHIYGFENQIFYTYPISTIVYFILGFILSRQYALNTNGHSRHKKIIVYTMVMVSLVHSIIIIAQFVIPSLKDFIEGFLYQDPLANIDYETSFRARGFSAAGGAAMSAYLALSIWLIFYLNILKKIDIPTTFLFAIIISFATFLIGRTGLVGVLIYFSIYFFYLFYKSMFNVSVIGKFKFFVIPIFLIVFYFSYTSFLTASENNLELATWSSELFDNGLANTSSFKILTEQMLFLPSDPVHLLFGIGYFEGDGYKYGRSDSGFIKTIFSIGIIGSLLFYGIFIAYVFKFYKNKKALLLLIPILLVLLIFEIKEPMLYQNFTGRTFIFLLGVLYAEEQNGSRLRNPTSLKVKNPLSA